MYAFRFRLCGRQAIVVEALVELVDGYLAVHSVHAACVTGLGLSGGRHHRAEEVRRGGFAGPVLVGEFTDVLPQALQLFPAPAVRAPMERYLELFVTLDEPEEGDLLGAHALPFPACAGLCRPPAVRNGPKVVGIQRGLGRERRASAASVVLGRQPCPSVGTGPVCAVILGIVSFGDLRRSLMLRPSTQAFQALR